MRQRDLKSLDKPLRGKASNLDLVEVRVRQLLKQLSDSNLEIARLQNELNSGQSGVSEAVQTKDQEIEEKERIIRRQQTLLKTKESAYQELQDVYTEQRREIEALKEATGPVSSVIAAEPAHGMSSETKARIKEHLNGILEKLERLETMP